MKVWIDQFLCIGCGLCTVISPPTFTLGQDYLAYVKDVDGAKFDSGRHDVVVDVIAEQASRVQQAANDCPAECIFIE